MTRYAIIPIDKARQWPKGVSQIFYVRPFGEPLFIDDYGQPVHKTEPLQLIEYDATKIDVAKIRSLTKHSELTPKQARDLLQRTEKPLFKTLFTPPSK